MMRKNLNNQRTLSFPRSIVVWTTIFLSMMKVRIPAMIVLIMTLFCFIDLEAAVIIEADWQCVVLDQTQKKWVGFASFKRTAKQKAMDSCKKQSFYPKTCAHAEPCFSPNNSLAQPGLWVCTALDRNGDPWVSNGANDKWSAALAAKGYCKSKSTIPHTCYVNTVTCRKRGI